ncbi:unnamed protein product (mitochondrion) [Musa banksii]
MNIYNFLTDKGKRRYARVYPIECLYLKKDVNSIFIVLYRRVMRSSCGSPSFHYSENWDPEFSFPEKVPSFNIMIGSTRPDPKCNLILGSTRSGPIVSQYPI